MIMHLDSSVLVRVNAGAVRVDEGGGGGGGSGGDDGPPPLGAEQLRAHLHDGRHHEGVQARQPGGHTRTAEHSLGRP